jgi:nucleoside-diphosphate-sugar epimerase
LKKKKILIIGSTSVIGKYLEEHLSKFFKVKFAGRKDANYFLNLNDLSLNQLNLPKNIRFDVVVHAAADFGGDSYKKILNGLTVNSTGTLKVCQLAKKVKAKHLIIISTISTKLKPFHDYYNIYSISKKHAEELAQFYCNRFNLPLTILRPTAIYDSQSKCKSHQKLLYMIIDKAQKGENIYFHGSKNPLRNYLYIDDFCEIILRVVKKFVIGIYDCEYSKNTSINMIAKLAYKIFNKKGKVIFLKKKLNISNIPYKLDNTLYKKIEYFPRVNISNGIKKIKIIRGIF